MKQMSLPNNLWGEDVSTAAYILNRCPTKKLKEKVPNEMWFGRKASVGHLRFFGALCYKHVPDSKRRKLDDKICPMILVGYHPTRAYRLYIP